MNKTVRNKKQTSASEPKTRTQPTTQLLRKINKLQYSNNFTLQHTHLIKQPPPFINSLEKKGTQRPSCTMNLNQNHDSSYQMNLSLQKENPLGNKHTHNPNNLSDPKPRKHNSPDQITAQQTNKFKKWHALKEHQTAYIHKEIMKRNETKRNETKQNKSGVKLSTERRFVKWVKLPG